MGFALLALFYLVLVLIMAFNVTKGFLHRKIKNMMLGIMNPKKE
jgi:hypothetical protein